MVIAQSLVPLKLICNFMASPIFRFYLSKLPLNYLSYLVVLFLFETMLILKDNETIRLRLYGHYASTKVF